MTNENQTASVQMYRPWVGVLLSFFIAGGSQFLAGKKLNGVIWLLVLALLNFSCLWCLTSPIVPGDVPAIILWIVFIVSWIVMLIKSYRPVPRLRWFGWICFIFLCLILSEAFGLAEKSFVRPFSLPTSSMSPTIQRGDLLVAACYALGNNPRAKYHWPCIENLLATE